MIDSPKIIFWAYDINSLYPKIEPASVRREWMDKTYNKIAYICTPLSSANTHGWEIKLPQDVIIRWDGKSEGIDGESPDHVQILSGEKYQDLKIVSNETGIGQVTFSFNVIAETDKDHYIIVSGPPNYIFPDAEPLTTLWRSDYYVYQPLMISWKITTADKDIVFPKNMPIAFINIYPKNLLESTDIVFKPMSDKMLNDSIEYHNNRYEHFKDNGMYDFPQFYKKGIGPKKTKIFEGQKTIKLKPTKYIKPN